MVTLMGTFLKIQKLESTEPAMMSVSFFLSPLDCSAVDRESFEGITQKCEILVGPSFVLGT